MLEYCNTSCVSIKSTNEVGGYVVRTTPTSQSDTGLTGILHAGGDAVNRRQ